MIKIEDKTKCCGCGACIQICPKKCIRLQTDNEGFWYPKVDEEICIDCNLCNKTCPILNQFPQRYPLRVFAAKNPNKNERMKSSSGGIFILLAKRIIDEGGVVFGAAFNSQWELQHSSCDTHDNLRHYLGSKYVQSFTAETFVEVKKHLLDGKKILFSGTPCQIAGLKKFLKKDYENLYTIDLICHGVPSPLVWRKYLEKIICPQGKEKNTVLSFCYEKRCIQCISFRSKKLGWKKFGFELLISARQSGKNSVLAPYKYKNSDTIEFFEPLDKNLYLRGFLKNWFLRPSCHECAFRKGKSHSDITLGDFWGVWRTNPEFADNSGVSLVLVNTEKGQALFNALNVDKKASSYQTALKYNPCLETSVSPPKERELFWKGFEAKGIETLPILLKQTEPGLHQKTLNLIKRIIRLIIR